MLVGAVGQLMRGAAALTEVMYLGGGFNGASSVRASTRNRAAAVDPDVTANTDAMVEAWDPNCSNTVLTMVLNGSDMYLGGAFATVRGTARNRAACVDSDPSQAAPTLRAWDPNCDSSVWSMILNGSDMYLCGQFLSVRGTTRNRAACVDSDPSQAAPTLRAWDPDCDADVLRLLLNGSDMYLGGKFTTVSGVTRNGAACVASDPTTNTLRSWNPNIAGDVWSMILNGSDMYLGGNFTTVRGTARNNAACVDSDSSQATPTLRAWDPNCSSVVEHMILNDVDMYLCGHFLTVRGTARNRTACVDSDPASATPTLRAWNPDCNNIVLYMILNGSDIYLGGYFVTVSGDTRDRAACVDSDSAEAAPALRDWDPDLSGFVRKMILA